MGPSIPCFELLMMCALSFKARMYLLFMYFITYTWWIPQIHFECDIWELPCDQHGS